MLFRFHDADGGLLIIQADGAINDLPSGEFLAHVQRLRDQGLRKVVVDCGKLHYISTPGICALVQVHHWMRTRGGEMRVCTLQPMIQDVFRTTRLDRLFDVHPNLDSALASFGVVPSKSA